MNYEIDYNQFEKTLPKEPEKDHWQEFEKEVDEEAMRISKYNQQRADTWKAIQQQKRNRDGTSFYKRWYDNYCQMKSIDPQLKLKLSYNATELGEIPTTVKQTQKPKKQKTTDETGETKQKTKTVYTKPGMTEGTKRLFKALGKPTPNFDRRINEMKQKAKDKVRGELEYIQNKHEKKIRKKEKNKEAILK